MLSPLCLALVSTKLLALGGGWALPGSRSPLPCGVQGLSYPRCMLAAAKISLPETLLNFYPDLQQLQAKAEYSVIAGVSDTSKFDSRDHDGCGRNCLWQVSEYYQESILLTQQVWDQLLQSNDLELFKTSLKQLCRGGGRNKDSSPFGSCEKVNCKCSPQIWWEHKRPGADALPENVESGQEGAKNSQKCGSAHQAHSWHQCSILERGLMN